MGNAPRRKDNSSVRPQKHPIPSRRLRPAPARLLLQRVTRGLPQPPVIFLALPHSFPGRDRVLEAIHPHRRLVASQANAPRLFSQHVNLLPRHRRAVRLGPPGEFVANLLSAPASFHACLHLLPAILLLLSTILHHCQKSEPSSHFSEKTANPSQSKPNDAPSPRLSRRNVALQKQRQHKPQHK